MKISFARMTQKINKTIIDIILGFDMVLKLHQLSWFISRGAGPQATLLAFSDRKDHK
jgi:hypothetical protein